MRKTCFPFAQPQIQIPLRISMFVSFAIFDWDCRRGKVFIFICQKLVMYSQPWPWLDLALNHQIPFLSSPLQVSKSHQILAKWCLPTSEFIISATLKNYSWSGCAATFPWRSRRAFPEPTWIQQLRRFCRRRSHQQSIIFYLMNPSSLFQIHFWTLQKRRRVRAD